MIRILTITAALIALIALTACSPEAPTQSAQPAPSQAEIPAQPAGKGAKPWDVVSDRFDAIASEDRGMRLEVQCTEGAKTLQITATPGASTPITRDAAVQIKMGADTFAGVLKADAQTPQALTVLIPATPDSVTALMLTKNVSLHVADPKIDRTGIETDSGVFDIFGTTCAQINGMRGG